MKATERFLLGGLLVVLAIAGLALAAHHDAGSALYWAGLVFAAACVALIFIEIREASTAGDDAPALPLRPILRNVERIRARGYEVMSAMNAIEKFAIGGVLGIFAVVSLFVAARHGEGASYWGGIAFFVICVGLIFYQISGARYGSRNDEAH